MALRPNEATVLYNAACLFCHLDQKVEAMDALKKSVGGRVQGPELDAPGSRPRDPARRPGIRAAVPGFEFRRLSRPGNVEEILGSTGRSHPDDGSSLSLRWGEGHIAGADARRPGGLEFVVAGHNHPPRTISVLPLVSSLENARD